MNPAEFKTVVVNTIGPQLSALGYETDIQPRGLMEDGHVQFKKKLAGEICIIIWFQPSHPEIPDFFDFAVNLIRNAPFCDNYVKTPEYRRYQIYDRLAPILWIDSREDLGWRADYWWHFLNAEELQLVCLDALDKLLKYGIPHLEDLNSISVLLRG